MIYLFTGFRRFIEEMDETPSKKMGSDSDDADSSGGSYMKTLEDEFGIKWTSLKNILSSEPWIASHFTMGNNTHKISAWEIDPDSITDKGAYIRIKPTKGSRDYLKDGSLDKGALDTNRYYVTRKELEKMLTTAWVPQQPAGGDMGAMGGPPL